MGAIQNLWYHALGELSPEDKQKIYDQVYGEVKAAGGTDAQADAAARQAISDQVTGNTGSYLSAAGAVATNRGGAAGDAVGSLIGDIGSAVDSVTKSLGNAVGNVVSGKILLLGIIILGIVYFEKK